MFRLKLSLSAVALLSIFASAPAYADVPKACPTGKSEIAPCPTCETVDAFDDEVPWHNLSGCFRARRNAWIKEGPLSTSVSDDGEAVANVVREEILGIISQNNVVFLGGNGKRLTYADVFDDQNRMKTPVDRLIMVNDRREAYNAMGQTDMAYFLYQFAVAAQKGRYEQSKADVELYRSLARASAETVLADAVDGNGLATRSKCADAPDLECAWYHSVTRKDRPSAAGSTLNQMLHAIRDFGMMSDTVTKQGWDEGIDFDEAVADGLHQLVYSGGYKGSGTAPDLKDFESDEPAAGDGIWAFYGFDSSKTGDGGYFLKNKAKNCHYHVHVLDLFEGILSRYKGVNTEDYMSVMMKLKPVLTDLDTAAEKTENVQFKSVECNADAKTYLQKVSPF